MNERHQHSVRSNRSRSKRRNVTDEAQRQNHGQQYRADQGEQRRTLEAHGRDYTPTASVLWDVKQFVSAALGSVLLAVMSASPSSGQLPQDGPTRQEIAEAYKNTAVIVGWEKWRIKEIRGWSLHFKRVSEKRGLGLLTRQYWAVAKRNGSCVEYQITDTIPVQPNNVQIKPILVVEPSGVRACR